METTNHKNGLGNDHPMKEDDLHSSSSSEDEEDEEIRCGFGPVRGNFLQRFANKKVYILVYSFLGFFQSMFFSYSIATLTTVEKQFKLKSQTTGILLSGNECSQILLSVVMTYFGGNGHRPRLVSLGIIFSGISSLLIVIPHFVYGKSTPLLNVTRNMDVCDPSAELFSPQCSDYNQSTGPMVYIFMSQFISGIGTTLFSTLGITYLDDNVKKKQSPMLIGLMSSLRMIGPVLGYGLAGMCIRRYVNLSEETTLKPSDPAWIGAWWLGFLVIGIAQLSTFWILALFPRRLPSGSKAVKAGKKIILQASKKSQRTLKEFPVALKRLLTNKILIFNNLSAVFYVFAFSGYITFLPKYLETQFQQSAATAGQVNGTIGIVFMCVGFLMSGFFISRYRPRAWVLAAWDLFTGTVFMTSLIIFAFVGCDSKPIRGITKIDDHFELQITQPCNMDCACSPNRFAPACSEDGRVNFFSACHAGCRSVGFVNGRANYSDCSCIRFNTTLDGTGADSSLYGGATGGYCPSDCSSVFYLYVIVMAFAKLLSSTGRVSNIIIGFRCVDPVDKSFAIGLGTMFISLFAFIPSPIVYGAIIDKACIMWRTECGKEGNCWLYDPTQLRIYLHFTTAAFVVLGIFFDAFACHAVRHLDLYKEDAEEDATDRKSSIDSNKQSKELELMMPDIK